MPVVISRAVYVIDHPSVFSFEFRHFLILELYGDNWNETGFISEKFIEKVDGNLRCGLSPEKTLETEVGEWVYIFRHSQLV